MLPLPHIQNYSGSIFSHESTATHPRKQILPLFLRNNMVPCYLCDNPYIKNPYTEMTRRLDSNCDFQALKKRNFTNLKSGGKEAALVNSTYLKNTCLEALSKGDLKNSCFADLDKLAWSSLYAFKKNVIDRSTFATLMLVRCVLKSYDDVRFIKLTDDQGELTAEAEILFKAMNPLKLDMDVKFLTPEQFTVFCELVKALPEHERFLIVKKDLDTEEGKLSISQVVLKTSYVQFFNRAKVTFDDREDNLRIFPSFGMMTALMKAKYGEDCTEINPVLGVSTHRDFELNGMFDARDFMLGFPEAELPFWADHMKAKGFDFHDHDMFHAIIAGSIEPIFKQLMVILACEIYNMEINDSHIKKLALSWYKRILDMEVNFARPEILPHNYPNITREMLFWKIFTRSIPHTVVVSVRKDFDELPSDHLYIQCLELMARTQLNSVVENFANSFFTKIKSNAELVDKFGLKGLADLHKDRTVEQLADLMRKTQENTIVEDIVHFINEFVFPAVETYPFYLAAHQQGLIEDPTLVDAGYLACMGKEAMKFIKWQESQAAAAASAASN